MNGNPMGLYWQARRQAVGKLTVKEELNGKFLNLTNFNQQFRFFCESRNMVEKAESL